MIDVKKELENIISTSKDEEERHNRFIKLFNDVTDERDYYKNEVEKRLRDKEIIENINEIRTSGDGN